MSIAFGETNYRFVIMKDGTKRTKTKLFVVIAALLVAFILFDKWRETKGGGGPEIDKSAILATMPEWELRDLTGDEYNSADLKGDVVLMHFWATWCGICRTEIPTLKEWDRRYRRKGFKIMAVAMEDTENKEIQAFVKGQRMKYKVLRGDSDIAEAFGGVDGVPTTFLVDRNGNIKLYQKGQMDKGFTEAIIKKLL